MRTSGVCAGESISIQVCNHRKNKEGGLKVELLAELKACARTRDLDRGRKIHSLISVREERSNVYLATALINMYGKCGILAEARRIFDGMPSHTVVSWTALILGLVENGQEVVALETFSHMISSGAVLPNSRTYVAALKACSRLAAMEGSSAMDGKAVKMRTPTPEAW
ncbi:pentatricopeptide repeat-containing protein At2g13600-like [Selaginella moellendorffii]|uniref:pentatricopeptide repeat-containing protein At2g13600-like n=1 Tax=Selaginella moellendorffii TaxID=88036 RepID=UPI000D1CED41|nr:pentatricopeptide repeat-containing protein At2g13600-like [Selaginella moellendorffii]|eukprot:XP_024519639.1 pentatricopeptide repeat-containing protein At2g13600-like [Selaginella moellendorffii]